MPKLRSFPLAILLACSVAGAFAKSFRAERYDVQLKLDQAGVLDVTETVVFRFTGGPFQVVFRDIATTETDGVTVVQASMDARTMPPGDGPGQVEIEGQSPVKVRWHFAPLADETHTFTVHYRVTGAIRKEADADTLIWRALPPGRKYRVDASEVVVQYPDGVSLETVGMSGRRAAVLIEPQRAIARMSDVKSDVRPTLRARFAKDSFASAKPAWMVRKESRHGEFLTGVRTAALAGLPLVAAAILLLVRLRGSGWSTPAGAPGPVTRPPSDLSPAMAARLAGASQGASGLLLDLARRGMVRIEEIEKRRFGSPDFRVIRAPGARRTAPHEERLLDILFHDGRTDVQMSKAGPRIHSKWGGVSGAINREMADAGLLDLDKRRRRHQMVAGGLIVLVLGLAAAGLGAKVAGTDDAQVGGILVIAGAALAIAGIFAMVAAATISEWTMTGAGVASQWKGFRDYLKDLSKGRAPMPGPDAIDQLLPYAAAFGIAPALLKQQQKTGAVSLPSWFAAFGSSGDGSAVASYIAFMSVSGGSSGGGMGASAGAGASGGGSSGAG